MRARAMLLVLLVAYVALLLPYAVHEGLGDAGVVVAVKKLSPHEISEILPTDGGNDYFLLLLEDSVSGERTLVVVRGDSGVSEGDVLLVKDKIAEWYVDWHDYDYFDGMSFETLVVAGYIEHISAVESCIEKSLASGIGSILFGLSLLDFYVMPLLIFAVCVYAERKLSLWHVLTTVCIFSLGILFCNSFAILHNVEISGLRKIFGAAFFVFLIAALWLRKYELDEEKREKIWRPLRAAWRRVVELLSKV
ncbi:hypothetical protein [Candidatus Alkanophaga liquidiphilum]